MSSLGLVGEIGEKLVIAFRSGDTLDVRTRYETYATNGISFEEFDAHIRKNDVVIIIRGTYLGAQTVSWKRYVLGKV